MKIIFSDKAKKEFLKLDKAIQKQIKNFLTKLATIDDPKSRGKALVGNLAGFWRYRVGNYRLLCRIIENELVIVVVEVGHRSEIYK